MGSNSVLLLVARREAGEWQVLREATWVTALGEGTKTTGILNEPNQLATLAALKEAKALAEQVGPHEWRAGGTMALRIAENAPEFLARAEAQGTPVEIVSGEAEAELGFEAVATDPLFASESRLSIIDPGGQSTELVLARQTDLGWEPEYRKSFPVGALGLRETLMSEPSPDAAARFRATAHLDQLLEDVPSGLEAGRVVALGATGTNLISIREKLENWQPERVHGQVLDYEEISRACAWLMDMDDVARGSLVGIERGREKTIHIGSLILERFLYALKSEACTVSVRGWRHAYLERDR